MLQLAGRVAAITGWRTAVGIGIARAYLAEGASLALLAGDAEEAGSALAGLEPRADPSGPAPAGLGPNGATSEAGPVGLGPNAGISEAGPAGLGPNAGSSETGPAGLGPNAGSSEARPAGLGPTAATSEAGPDDGGAAAGRTMIVTGDASVQADLEGFIDATVGRYGRIDILVHQAGAAEPTRPVVDITDEEWDAVLHGVLYSAFWATRAGLRVMIPAGTGRVIIVSAAGDDDGDGEAPASPALAAAGEAPASPALAAASEAVTGLTRSVAAAIAGTGITINALVPGPVRAGTRSGRPTPAGGGRPNTVEEVAAIALFLASDAGRSVNGAVVVVEGGTAHY